MQNRPRYLDFRLTPLLIDSGDLSSSDGHQTDTNDISHVMRAQIHLEE